MTKQVKVKIKLIVPAGQATPAPPIGPSLSQHGINVVEFCNKFNEATKELNGIKIPVEITIYKDQSFELTFKKPPVSSLIKSYLKIEKGSGEPGRKFVGVLSKEDVRKIAEEKLPDLNTQDLEKALKIVEGTAKSMGVKIEE